MEAPVVCDHPCNFKTVGLFTCCDLILINEKQVALLSQTGRAVSVCSYLQQYNMLSTVFYTE